MSLPLANVIIKRYVDGLADVRIIVDSNVDISVFGTDFLPGSEIFCNGEGTPTYVLNAQHEWEQCDESEAGVSSYSDLTDKPSIEGHTLNSGSNTAASLGLATDAQVSAAYTLAANADSKAAQTASDLLNFTTNFKNKVQAVPTTYSAIELMQPSESEELDLIGLIQPLIATAIGNMALDGYRGFDSLSIDPEEVPLALVAMPLESTVFRVLGLDALDEFPPEKFLNVAFLIPIDNLGNYSVFKVAGLSSNLLKLAMLDPVDVDHSDHGYLLPSFSLNLEGIILSGMNPIRITLSMICEKELVEVSDPDDPDTYSYYYNPVGITFVADAVDLWSMSGSEDLPEEGENTIVLTGDFANGSTPALPSGFTFPTNPSSDFSAVLEVEGHGMESGNPYELEIPFFAYFSDETDGDRIYFGENPDTSNPEGILSIDNNTDTGVRTLSSFYAPGYPDAEWTTFTLTITDARTGS